MPVGYPAAAMQPRPTDPRTEDTISYDLVRTDRKSGAEGREGCTSKCMTVASHSDAAVISPSVGLEP